ncbi:hypothetical protein NRIC_03760 [Enterococcus florum]|uniref:DNA-binding protein n=1 Tax=Enterococcus florum TaxID=2480627 RepID=A0A4P5P3Y9_9ENTE|nr:hypothetical protein [Enterococcus florum]GCF92485.1 hypothetical protein NRIC_03760 [Enterococcus florum]
MNKKELEQIKKFMENDLLTKSQAMEITGQSPNAFAQSLKSGKVSPFYEAEGTKADKVRLYLREDIETYAKNKRK